MILKDYEERSGKRVWLTNSEIDLLIDCAGEKKLENKTAILLAARCGLRRAEIAGGSNKPGIRSKDLIQTEGGLTIRVYEQSESKYREVPAPQELLKLTLAMRRSDDERLVSCDPSTIYDWVSRASQRCRAKTSDDDWKHVSPHDLRRSWAHLLLQQGVLPSVVMEWGGWEDLTTFSDKYLNEFSETTLVNERGKVRWLSSLGSSSQSNKPESFSKINTDEV